MLKLNTILPNFFWKEYNVKELLQQTILMLVDGFSKTSTAQKMKFSIKDFFSKCDQIIRKLRIWSHLPKKSLKENFIFCAVIVMKILKILNSCISNFLMKKYQTKAFLLILTNPLVSNAPFLYPLKTVTVF